jgi:two-component system chemotaxis response regulator CheB
MSDPVRVLVVDDSALMRKLIPQILAADSAIQVIGTAMDGTFALRKMEEMRPDVVTLDLEMPRMDGLETLREITRHYNVPVIVVSAHTRNAASAAFNALALGAFDFVTKPDDAASGHLEEITMELTAKIKVAAQVGARRVMPVALPPLPRREAKPVIRQATPPTRVVAIGISTGGPNALQYLFSQMRREFPGTILVVQHMPEGFTEMFARRLDEHCSLQVKEAQSGDLLLVGRVLICPGNRHMKVRRRPGADLVVLSDQPRVNGHRPSADVLFQSVAHEIGGKAVALLMTGMGVDGAEGMGAVKAAGGLTLVQSPETCVVDAMPRAAIEKGFASRIVALNELASTLQAECALTTPGLRSEPVTFPR